MKGEDGKISTVKVSLKYIPVRMQLDPSESINNMGNLRVDILDGHDLPAADSNGKSDPYCKFELNGQEVFKTKVQKKTLNPAWNEFFEVVIPSRTAAKFVANVYDYDFADKPDFLGAADVRLDQLEPFKARELTLPLDGKSGSVRVRLLFRPDYITRMRQGTSTFSGTFATPGKIVTGVAGAPIKGGAAVVGAVGQGVGKGASFLRRGFKSKKDDDANGSPSRSSVELARGAGAPANGTGSAVPSVAVKRATGLTDAEPTADLPPAPAVNTAVGGAILVGHARTRSMGASSIHSVAPSGPGAGQAVFTIVSASDFPPSSDVYVTINQLGTRTKVVGKTKHHKASGGGVRFDETFKGICTPDTQFQIQVREHHSFGSDDTLGESLYVVDESGTNSEKEVRVGDGTVVIKSNFTPNEPAGNESPKSTFRRSFLSKRDSRAPSRDGTPA